MSQLWVDLDGTLCDFDAGYEKAFGYRPDKIKGDVDWNLVAAIPNFYRNLSPMPDMHIIWGYISKYQPIVLTGVPSGVSEAADNKYYWVKEHLGSNVKVICYRSKEKSRYCQPGDILIDDWEKYKQLWINKGGDWITHISAEDTIRQLVQRGY